MSLKKLLKLLTVTVLLVPVTALAWFPFSSEAVDLWALNLRTKTNGVCVHNVAIYWPDGMGMLKVFGETPLTLCSVVGPYFGTNFKIEPGITSIKWTDQSNITHSVDISIVELTKNYTVYGGDLIFQFDNDQLAILLAEPNKSHPSVHHVWPVKKPITLYISR